MTESSKCTSPMAFHAGQQINFEQSLLNNISSFTLKSGERLSKRIFEQPTNGLYPISSRVFGNTIVRIPLQFQKELRLIVFTPSGMIRHSALILFKTPTR